MSAPAGPPLGDEGLGASRDHAHAVSGDRVGAAVPRATTPTTCIEHQAGRPTLRLSFQIKVF